MINLILCGLVLLSASLFLVLIFFIKKNNSLNSYNHDQSIILTQLENLRKQFGENMADTRHSVREDLKDSEQMMSRIYHQLGHITEAAKQIHTVATGVSNLNDLLKTPKYRGQVGESLLTELLTDILPADLISFQHNFDNGRIADAAIQINQKWLCIDSKFPMESFRQTQTNQGEPLNKAKKEFVKAIKKHIDDIALKYIDPACGTWDIALMYIPAENVYYEAFISPDKSSGRSEISAYALNKCVIPVSPNTFHAYLNTLLLGYRGFQMSTKTREFMGKLSDARKELQKVLEGNALIKKNLLYAAKHHDQNSQWIHSLFTSLDDLSDNPETSSSHPELIQSDSDLSSQ
ncbi:MAG: DNA recombination protein RmuC [Candidatus Omnitrophota bacterium]|jgi:DNA recombination protein RmuC